MATPHQKCPSIHSMLRDHCSAGSRNDRCLPHAREAFSFYSALASASDNTAAEAGIKRLFTASEPLSGFLKTVAEWSARTNVRLALTHLAGEKNVWADELSRKRTHRFAPARVKGSASPSLHGPRREAQLHCTPRVQLGVKSSNEHSILLETSRAEKKTNQFAACSWLQKPLLTCSYRMS